MTVPDTSENATANLSWTDIKLPRPVFEGDTLWAESEVLDCASPRSRPQRRDRRRPDAGASTSSTRS